MPLKKRRHAFTRHPAYLVLIALLVAPACAAEAGRTIAVFGSSVASGSVDQEGGGYCGRLKALLAERGWEVINVSRGGDNTVKIQPRFQGQLVPANPDYIIIGLSLANEGLRKDGAEEQLRVFEQFRTGMLRLIQQCRDMGMKPIVANCYPHDDYREDHYALLRRMNLLINTWDVPSINFLGTVDNGAGQWAQGHEADSGHPNSRGHEAMFRAIVPTLFDAMDAGKPTPARAVGSGFARIRRGADTGAPLEFVASDPIHAHAVAFWVRSGGEGAIAGLSGDSGAASIEYGGGHVTYKSTAGKSLSAKLSEPDAWHHVVVSHRYCNGETMFLVDGQLAGTVEERHQPERFALGGAGLNAPPEAHYRDWCVWRAALNEDEAKAVYNGKLLQASLEVYAPLRDGSFADGAAVINGAQSMSEVMLSGTGVQVGEDTCAWTAAASAEGHPKVIFDTDMTGDCDDCGALAVLHALADKGEVEILGCIASFGANPYIPGCMDAINTYYGRGGLPIGAEQEDYGRPDSRYLEAIALDKARYGHDVVTKEDVPDHVRVYRRLLVGQPDGTVTIVTVGRLKGLYDLLESGPDEVSALDGVTLVKEKVLRWVCMGGRYPNGERKRSANFGTHGGSEYTKKAIESWPLPALFTGFEIGAEILTGPALLEDSDDNPVARAYRLYFEGAKGKSKLVRRPSWDQTAIVLAVRGVDPWWRVVSTGHNHVHQDGVNEWLDAPDREHAYVIERKPPEEVAALISSLMVQAPKTKAPAARAR